MVEGARIVLSVRDNGTGFPVARSGRVQEAPHRMGLTGMKERLLAAGGHLALSNHGDGAEVRIALPLRLEASA
jgi:signal transduction histidine kinase